MNVNFFIFLVLIPVIGCAQGNKSKNTNTKNQVTMKTLHEYRATTIDGNEFNFSELKGKKVMIVNTASKCGLTPQYVQLEQLYKKYGAEKFVIIGFPANDFLGQEPASNEEIAAFCQKNYGVSFQMMEKISVKGKAIHPIYQWLTLKEQNGVQDASVTWNFQKFLIDENGNWVKSVSPKESPDSEEVLNWLNN